MNLKKVSIKPFSAKVTFGLEIGYTKNLIEKSDMIKFLQDHQNQLIQDKNLILSVSLSHLLYCFKRTSWASCALNFINYPKFPLEDKALKNEIENLTKHFMKKFKQNRVVIEYLDETIMLENSELIDPRIKVNN